MKIKALESFSGAFSMYKGETRDCDDKEVIDDLLQAGYIEKVPDAPREGVKKNESKRSSNK